MIQTSERYKQAVYAPTRMIKARLRHEILDKTAFRDNTKTVTSEASISRASQLTNKLRQASNKYALFERDYTKLDGSFCIPPKAVELPDSEIGWLSNTLSDDAGIFIPYQVLEFSFTDTHSSMGLTIYFDILCNEYATDFDIDVYAADDSIIAHEEIIGNADTTIVYVNQLTDYKKVAITIKKWCKPCRRAKVIEVDFGVIKVYQDSDLINLTLLQELDITSATLPAGELKATVNNSDREFDILNPQGFYSFLKSGQEMILEMGVELDNGDFEFVPVGKYYLSEQQSDSLTGSVPTITYTARDILDLLSDDGTENLEAENITLYDLAVRVMTACNIEDYILSDNLKYINTKGLYQSTTYRNLLQLISIAGMCVVYSDNAGKLHMEQLISARDVMSGVDVTSEASISNKMQVINKVITPTFNIATLEKNRTLLDGSFKIPQQDMSGYETGWISGELSGEDGAFTTPQVIMLTMSAEHSSTNLQLFFDVLNKEYATAFNIKAYDADDALLFSVDVANNTKEKYLYQNNLLANSRRIIITINQWSKPCRRARIVEIGFDLPLDNITFEDMYSPPKIALIPAVKAVEVTYYPNDGLDTKAIYTAIDENIKGGSTLKVDNSLINTQENAKNVAEWLLKASQKTANFEVSWRQNPALCLADKVTVENGFGTHSTGNIIRQQFEYQGYLRGTTNILGAI